MTSEARVNLSSSQACAFPFSQTFERLSHLLKARTWIISNHRLKILFEFAFNEVQVNHSSRAFLADHLRNVLSQAEVFIQFCVTESLSRTEP